MLKLHLYHYFFRQTWISFSFSMHVTYFRWWCIFIQSKLKTADLIVWSNQNPLKPRKPCRLSVIHRFFLFCSTHSGIITLWWFVQDLSSLDASPDHYLPAVTHQSSQLFLRLLSSRAEAGLKMTAWAAKHFVLDLRHRGLKKGQRQSSYM